MKMCTLFREEVRNYNTKVVIKSPTIENSFHPRLKINMTRRIKKARCRVRLHPFVRTTLINPPTAFQTPSAN